jgi:hypothetical protein
VPDLLAQCEAHGVTLAPGQNGTIRVSPPGVLPDELRKALQEHKGSVLRLLSAPPADVTSNEPCEVCGGRERWLWLDGRELCRICLVLGMMPMTLASPSTGKKQEARYLEAKER